MLGNLAAQLVAPVRDAAWLTGDRARGYGRVLAAASVLLALAWVALSRDGLDPAGQPLGTDFLSFWAASKLALAGTPALAYDPAAHAAVQHAVFGSASGFYAFFYPPVFLLVCTPLALLPWGVALPLWLGCTGWAYGRVVAAFAGRGAGLPIFAFPAVLLTAGHGQNAFLTAALFGGALLALRSRPVLAGVLVGALAIKPQLGLLIPLVLLASGAWVTLAAAAATVAGFALASTAAFGPGIWAAFLRAGPLARDALEQGLVGPAKMPSVFAAVQLWHGSLGLAYALQFAAGLTAAATVVRLLRVHPGSPAAGPALVAASLLASPFLLDYDLTLLALPLAWLLAEARRTGFRPWEKSVMLAAFTLPLLARLLAMRLGVPLGPPVIAALLVVVVRRGLAEASVIRPVARPALPIAAAA